MDAKKDLELAVNVREALMRDDRLSAHSFDVTVLKGTVTLRGTVQSYRRKLAAIEIVESIQGCRSIVDGILVIPTEAPPDTEAPTTTAAAAEEGDDGGVEPWVLVLVFIGFALLVAAIGWFVGRSRRDSGSGTPPPPTTGYEDGSQWYGDDGGQR